MLGANAARKMRGHVLSPIYKGPDTYSSTMKQAKLNSTILPYYWANKDMLDPLDLNSVAKARQINLQFIITAHIKL